MSLFTSQAPANSGQEEDLARAEQFQPQWDENQTRNFIQAYDKQSNLYNESQRDVIRQHAHYYNIPFYEGEFDLMEAVQQAGAGFVEGFTTFNIADHPDNEYEQIFRNIGHLAGFAPGIMSKPAQMLGLRGMSKIAAGLNDKSVPMMAANFLTKKAKGVVKPALDVAKTSRAAASGSAVDFLIGNRARHIAEGAFHLGAASAVSSWQGGIDEMMASFQGGAMAGAVFRTIGNVAVGGTPESAKIVRGISGSLFMGLPATMRGATTPEQIYEYLMGAYFGGQERPWRQAKAMKFINEFTKRRNENPEWKVHSDPEMDPAFEGLPVEVKPLVKQYAETGIPGTEFKGWGKPEERKLIHSWITERVDENRLSKPEKMEGFDTVRDEESGAWGYVPSKKATERLKSILKSGGDEGGQRLINQIADEYGIGIINYTFKGHEGIAKESPGLDYKLKPRELDEAAVHVRKADETLNRLSGTQGEYKQNLIRKTWFQIKNSDTVYGVGEIETKSDLSHLNKASVKRAPGWGVQMAIDNNKKVHVFDTATNHWNTYDPRVRRFVPTEGNMPKKPTRKWAFVSDTFSREGGVIPKPVDVALRKFFGTHFKLSKSTKPTAKEKKQLKDGKEWVDYKENLKDRIKTADDAYVKRWEELEKAGEVDWAGEVPGKDGKSVKHPDLVKLDEPIVELKAELKKLDKDMLINLETGEVKEKIEPIRDSEQSVDDIDVGTSKVLGRRPLAFVKEFMQKAWKQEVLDTEFTQRDLADTVATTMLKYVTGTKENLSDKWADNISKITNIPLERDARGKLRQILSEENLNKQIVMFGYNNGKLSQLNEYGTTKVPRTMSGARKRIKEPENALQIAFKENGGKGGAWGILDSITLMGKRGQNVDRELHRYYSQDLMKKHNYNEKAAQNEFDNMKASIIEQADRNGFYYYGGKGDADRIYLVKYNPALLNVFGSRKSSDGRVHGNINNYKKLFRDIEVARRKPGSNLHENMKYFEKDFLEARKEFVKKYTGRRTKSAVGRTYDDMYFSNILYDMQMQGFKIRNQKDFTEALLKMTNKNNDFINSPKAFNKRAQIWFTNSIGGDGEFISRQVNEKGEILVKDLYKPGNKDQLSLFKDSETGLYKFGIIEDLPKEILEKMNADKLYSSDLKRLSTELGEHVDGGIIVRNDVMEAMLLDAGMPKSGQSKSFIVSRDPENGAMLGKYMMHVAGDALSKQMAKDGRHMLMHESAIKQRGLREIGKVEHKNGEVAFKGKDYYLNPSDVFYNYSVVSDNAMMNPSRVAKQLLGSFLDNTLTPIPRDVIDDMFSSVVGNKFHGVQEVNDIFNEYTTTLSNKNLKQLEKNFNKLGVSSVIEGLRDPKLDKFAAMAYNKMLKMEKDGLLEDFQAGEMTKSEFQKEMAKVEEFESATHKRIGIAKRYIALEKQKGRELSPVSVYLHNEVRDWRMQVMRNFIVRETTKPRLDNSAIARMRPYDIGLQNDLDKANPLMLKNNKKGINHNQDIFMLDDAYKKMRITTDIPKFEKTTLGELWEAYNRGILNANKEAVEDVFQAATLRVPMDSVSGAHILNFKGFTGRLGHGILLNSKTMRALGGADLDGDEASFFFGGKGGFKKSWKDAIHANRGEFYETINKGTPKERTIVRDNKSADLPAFIKKQEKVDTFRDLLTKSGGLKAEEKRRLNSIGSMYSPTERIRISEAAVIGRQHLGTAAVTPSAIMNATHSAVVNSEKGKDEFFITKKEWVPTGDIDPGGKAVMEPVFNEYKVIAVPKTSAAWRKYAKELARAQVAFSSDPMDELGLKSADFWFKKLWNSNFDIVSISNDKGKQVKHIKPEDLSANNLKSGMFSKLNNINRAYWGYNYGEGRRFTMAEIKDLANGVYDLTDKQLGSFLSKTARLLQPLDWSDTLFKNLDRKTLINRYNMINQYAKDFKELQTLMGRSSLAVPQTNYILEALRPGRELWRNDVRHDVANNVEVFKMVMGLKEVPVGKTGKKMWKNKFGLSNIEMSNERWLHDRVIRKNILDFISRRADDFLSKDMQDMITLLRVSDIYQKMPAGERKMIPKIHKFADYIKDNSYLLNKERNNVSESIELGSLDPLIRAALEKFVKERPNMLHLLPSSLRDAITGGSTASLDQATIDKKILNFYKKNKLSDKQKKMFEHMLIGTYRRGDLEGIAKLREQIGKRGWTKGLVELVRQMENRAAKTSTSRVGWNSEVIRQKRLEEVVSDYIEMIDQSWIKPTEADVKTVEKSSKQMVKDIEGEKSALSAGEVVEEFNPTTGYEGLSKGVEFSKIPKNMRNTARELVTRINKYNGKVGKNLSEITRALFEKDWNAMTFQEMESLNNWFKDIQSGTIFQRIFDKKGLQKLRKRHWWLFPKTVNRELMRDDIALMAGEGYYLDASGNKNLGTFKKPTNYIEIAQSWINRMNDQATEQSEKWIREIRENLLFVDSFQEGEILRQWAIRKREAEYANTKEFQEDFISNKIFKDMYLKPLKELEKNHSDKLDTKYTINYKGKTQEYTGKEIIDLINKEYTGLFKNMHELMTGKLDKVTGENIALRDGNYIEEYYDKGTRKNPRIKWKKFITDMVDAWRRGENPSLDFGIDGLRHVTRSMQVELMGRNKFLRENHGDIIKGMKAEGINTTGKIPYEVYFPHMFFNKQKADVALTKALKKLKTIDVKEFDADPVKGLEKKKAEIAKLIHRHHNLTGEWGFQDMQGWTLFNDVMTEVGNKRKIRKNTIKWFGDNQRAGSMFSRNSHIEGWSVDASVVDAYIRSLSGSYHRQLSQIFSRSIQNEMFDKMHKSHNLEQAKAWSKFFELYVADAIGNPSIIPDAFFKDRTLQLKGTPYGWWADNQVAKRVDKIRKSLGLIKKDLPPELRETDLETVRHWSNLEAQYEMAALLAHPKSMITNIFGGTTHTIQSAGWRNWRESRDIGWLRKNINPKWNSIEDVQAFVEKAGVIPEYMLYEAGLKKEFKQQKNKEFIQEIARKIKKDPSLESESMRDIAQKYKVKDNIMEFAAKFMTVPERHIRRDAFMAHYVQAWKRFGGALKDPNHPFLIEMAKKGVKATQFLYSAPFRPAFARTALGKVMTRFQLWSWNAVRFRNDVYRQAKIHGFVKGTPEFERFARTAQIDMFVFALANVFAYSLFETSLPAPWNWLQDTSDWIFGDETERDRAFFGQWPTSVAPLQMVTPPILRALPASMRSLVNDDWSKMSEYYVWTMFPFGRMARDVAGPGNLIENPIRAVEKLSGFPLMNLQREMTKIKKGDRRVPTPGGNILSNEE